MDLIHSLKCLALPSNLLTILDIPCAAGAFETLAYSALAFWKFGRQDPKVVLELVLDRHSFCLITCTNKITKLTILLA